MRAWKTWSVPHCLLGLSAVMLLCVMSHAAHAQYEDAPPRPPKALTMEQKIRASDHVLLGSGMEVVFIDIHGNVLEKDPEHPRNVGARLIVKVKQQLWNRQTPLLEEITISLPNDGATGETLRSRFIERGWIFFIKVDRVKVNVRGQVETRVVNRYSRDGQSVYPHTVDDLVSVNKTLQSMGLK